MSASLTLEPPHPFAAGASVSLYKGFARTSGAPSGSPVTTAVVNASDLSLTFAGLEDGAAYFAYASGQYVSITAPPSPTVNAIPPTATVTRDSSGNVQSVVSGEGTYDTFVRSGGVVTSFHFNGATFAVNRDSQGRITGVA